MRSPTSRPPKRCFFRQARAGAGSHTFSRPLAPPLARCSLLNSALGGGPAPAETHTKSRSLLVLEDAMTGQALDLQQVSAAAASKVAVDWLFSAFGRSARMPHLILIDVLPFEATASQQESPLVRGEARDATGFHGDVFESLQECV